MPLQKIKALSIFGIVAGGLRSRTARRTYQASGPTRVSTIALPCTGRQDAARIISRTRERPNAPTIPGTVKPASEWPTMTTSSSPAFSICSTADRTQSAMLTVVRSPGVAPWPGMSMASTGNSGARWRNSSMVRSQQSADCSPPRTRTRAGELRLCHPEIDNAADDFTVEQVCVGIVDVVETVALGDHLVEQQLPALVELGQPVDVGLRVA